MAVALIAGILLMCHRELWSLVRGRGLPPVDERVRGNAGKSVRNGFIFFALASVCLMLFFSVNLAVSPGLVHVVGGLFLAVGVVYLLSYLFYERVKPRLDEKGLRILRTSLLIAGVSLATFIISVVMHNAIGALSGIEEPVFFVIAAIISPLAFIVGIIGSLVMFVKGLFSRVL